MILSIDTSTKSGSVALISDGKVLASQHYHIDKSHSALLHTMVDQMMKNTSFSLKDLTAIAISEGPGSYTGLRIGVSAAKGLCYALDIPLLAINTLEAMAYQVFKYSTQFDRYCPMIDARRMEVYSLMMNSDFKTISVTSPIIVDDSSYSNELKDHRIAFFGDGALKCQEIIKHKNAVFIQDVNPSAEEVGLLAIQKLEEGKFENLVSFEPFYLKEFRLATAKK